MNSGFDSFNIFGVIKNGGESLFSFLAMHCVKLLLTSKSKNLFQFTNK